jgi:hypothetical protein
MRYRVLKTQFPGVKMNGTVFIAAACAVFHIPFDDAAHCGQLSPDLVVTARKQLDFQQVVAITTAQVSVF